MLVMRYVVSVLRSEKGAVSAADGDAVQAFILKVQDFFNPLRGSKVRTFHLSSETKAQPAVFRFLSGQAMTLSVDRTHS